MRISATIGTSDTGWRPSRQGIGAIGCVVRSVLTIHGTIGFGGGRSATEDETTWTGQLSADESRELENLLRTHGWFEREPASSPQPPKRTYEQAGDGHFVQVA